MKVLLIQPPFNKAMFSIGHLEPLGLEILAASIKPRHDVVFLDMSIDQNLSGTLENVRPDVIGITALTVQASTAKQVAQEVKKYDPNIFTVVGGHHASMIPDDFNIPAINAIVLNQGYTSFPALMESLDNGGFPGKVPGLAFPGDSGLIFSNQLPFNNLDDMPKPDRSISQKYRRKYDVLKLGPTAVITTAIGCPYKCTFCACWKITDGKYFVRDPEVVVDEIAAVDEQNIMFADDNTFQDVKRAFRLYELIRDRGIKKKYFVYTRSDTVANNPALIEKWSEIGLDITVIGMEAINNEVLNDLNKRNSVENNERAIEILKTNGVKNFVHLIVMQDFVEKDFDELWRFVKNHDLWFPVFPVYTPLPGTKLLDENKDKLLTDTFDLFDLFHSVLPTKLPLGKFIAKIEELYLRNFSVWRYMKKRMWQLSQLTKGKKLEKRTGEIMPLVPLIVLNRTFREAFKRIKKNHVLLVKDR